MELLNHIRGVLLEESNVELLNNIRRIRQPILAELMSIFAELIIEYLRGVIERVGRS